MQALAVLSLALTLLQPQTVSKKVLDHTVYDSWNSLRGTTLSRDGKWLATAVAPQEGNIRAEIRSTKGDTLYQFSLGQSLTLPTGAPITPRMVFSHDSKFLIAIVQPKLEDTRKARKEKAKPDDLPKNTLVILNLATGEKTEVPRVASFQIAEDDLGYIAYRQEPAKAGPAKPAPASPATTAPVAPAAQAETKPDEAKKVAKKADHKAGEAYTLRQLSTGKETTLEDVASLAFSRKGSHLAIVRSTKDGSGDGVEVLTLGESSPKNVIKGLGRYRVAISPDAGHIAVSTDRDDYAAKKPLQSLYLHEFASAKTDLIAKVGSKGIPTDWIIAETGPLSFSENGTRLNFSIAEKPDEDREVDEDDRVSLDVWNYKDQVLQPQQLLQVAAERNRSYLTIYTVKTKTILQVATLEQRAATISRKGDGDYALTSDTRPYQREASWTGQGFSDYWLVNLTSGQRTKIATKTDAGLTFSPGGGYLTGYEEGNKAYVAYSVQDPKRKVLNAKLPPVWDDEDDHPAPAPSLGSAGWTKDDAWLLVNDRFDVWGVDPQGVKEPVNLTQGVGRRWGLRFRTFALNSNQEFTDLSKPILFSAVDVRNADSGFYRLEPGGEFRRLFVSKHLYGTPGLAGSNVVTKAEDGETIVYTRQNFTECPNVYVADDLGFTNARRVTDSNPQQKDFNWGTVEHVSYTTNDGIPCQGLLVKPENFDPSKKYPMIVYFYERDADTIHQYRSPAPSASTVNLPYFASNGYVILVPDIPYKIGYPGESAVNAILPATHEVLRMGFVDPKRVGIQGQSWGGYQVAYLVTETNLFAAAGAGAPVSNMVSAYGGIRWGSGLVRQFQYETGQSRIGGSVWDYPLRYLENSPIFHADKVRTPLLIMSNDKDGAVPWYQGIEYFTALRRLDRPSWLLVYNNEDHNLVERRNRKDLSVRLAQFFDHYLKGAPMPIWMSEGIPAVKKGKTMGFEIKK
ncbi:MAG: alpha/beta hydrolase family protein [Fimbriimonas sp.]